MINKLLQFSINNRILIVIAAIFLAGIGIYNFTRLPIDAVPDITNVQVQINTEAEGLSTVQIEKQITFPIETAMSGLPKLSEVRSLSRFGFSQVTVVFDDDTDIYWARQLVGEKLQQARESIPSGLGEPKMGPVSTGLGEIFFWTIAAKESARNMHGQPYSLTDLRVVQDWIIKPQLLNVKGVTEINSIGGFEKQIHIEPFPEKLISYELNFNDVLEALEANNAFAGGGYIESRGEQYIIQASGLIKKLETIQQIPLITNDGVPVYIHDVADVHFGEALRTGAATYNGEEAVIGTAMMLIGENSRAVSMRVAEALKEVNKSLPEGVHAEVIYNRTNLVNAAVSTVQKNLIEGALLVIAILFFILGNFRIALFVALSIPLSMLFAVTGMVRFGISGNLMSMGAIDFGIIIDGSIVMAENIIRRFAEAQHSLKRLLTKEERLKLAYESAREVAVPVVSGVVIIMIVYLPILTLTGIEGKMFVPMAEVVLLALAGALIISFTFIPAMIALFLTGEVKEKDGKIMTKVKSFYQTALNWTLPRGKLVIGLASSFLVIVGLLATLLGSEFVPSLDEQDIAIQSLRIPATSVSQSVKMQKEIEKAVLELPEIDKFFSRIGTAEVATDPMPPGIADGYVIVKDRSEWPDPSKSKLQLISEIEDIVEEFPGNLYEFSQPIELRFNELISGVRSDVAVKIFGDDLTVLQDKASEIEAVLNQIKGASDVKTEQSSGLTTLQIDIDREQIARYGINITDVQDVVSLAVGGKSAGQFFEGDKRFDIIVRLPESLREELSVIKNLPVPLPIAHSSDDGDNKHNSVYDPKYVPLSMLANIELVEGLNQVSRENTKRRVVVQSNVRGRDMGSFVDEASELIEKNVTLPAGYWYKWGGQFENLEKARERLLLVVPVSLLLIFLVLFVTFGSIKDSLVIFTGVPFALTGGVLALLLRGIPFSISAGIGFIALSGVAVLNGVVMLSFIKHLYEEGKPIEEAIKEGALVRLRPVLMTALVASLGFIPMALATSTGAEVQRPLATVVIGGIISSTVLTLLVLPVLYKIFNRKA